MVATFHAAVAPPGYMSVPDAFKVLGNPKQLFGLELLGRAPFPFGGGAAAPAPSSGTASVATAGSRLPAPSGRRDDPGPAWSGPRYPGDE